jgi:hypothetical protein
VDEDVPDEGGAKLGLILQASGGNWKEVLNSNLGYAFDPEPIAAELEYVIGGNA